MDEVVDRRRVGSSVIAAIGGTPLVALSRVIDGLEGRVLAKLDYLNPGGSKKDRIARRMIEDAESSGELGPGQPVVELTSGNTGTGLAIVCAVTGHPFVAVMSAGNSAERAQILAGFSGGACLAGAEQLLRGPHAGGTVVIVLADSGMKYLSTDLWTDELS